MNNEHTAPKTTLQSLKEAIKTDLQGQYGDDEVLETNVFAWVEKAFAVGKEEAVQEVISKLSVASESVEFIPISDVVEMFEAARTNNPN